MPYGNNICHWHLACYYVFKTVVCEGFLSRMLFRKMPQNNSGRTICKINQTKSKYTCNQTAVWFILRNASEVGLRLGWRQYVQESRFVKTWSLRSGNARLPYFRPLDAALLFAVNTFNHALSKLSVMPERIATTEGTKHCVATIVAPPPNPLSESCYSIVHLIYQNTPPIVRWTWEPRQRLRASKLKQAWCKLKLQQDSYYSGMLCFYRAIRVNVYRLYFYSSSTEANHQRAFHLFCDITSNSVVFAYRLKAECASLLSNSIPAVQQALAKRFDRGKTTKSCSVKSCKWMKGRV